MLHVAVNGIANAVAPDSSAEPTKALDQPASPATEESPEPDSANRLSVVSIPESSPSQTPSGDGYDSDSSAYLSFDEGDDDDTGVSAEQRRADAEEREAERRRVLKAAGLTINVDPANVPPVPPRRRKTTTIKTKLRRAPPPVPATDSEPRSPSHANRDLPPTPTSPGPSLLALEDAYDKYEHFKQSNRNRFSTASTATDFTTTTTPGSGPPSISFSPPLGSKDTDSHSKHSGTSGLFSFLRSSSQVSTPSSMDRRPVISGPIAIAPPSEIDRSPSPSFGLVSR